MTATRGPNRRIELDPPQLLRPVPAPPVRERWQPNQRRVGWLVLAVLVFCSYNTWVLWRPMNGDELILNGYLSELSASDQPNNLFFRGGDLITSVIVLGLAVGLLRYRPPHRRQRWRTVTTAALFLFAVSTFFDAFFAMDCSPTLSAACKSLEESGQLSGVHYAHTFTSVGAQIGITASLIAGTISLYRARTGRRATTAVVGTLAAIEVVALTVMMIMLAVGVPGIGYPQAVMVLVASVWFALVSIGHANPKLWTTHAYGESDETFELEDVRQRSRSSTEMIVPAESTRGAP